LQVQVGQPLASSVVPLGQGGDAQAMAGHTVPPPLDGGDEGVGGVQPPDGSVQLQSQGGQVSPGAHAGQAQPQPIGGGGIAVWHTPETHVCPAMQGAP
jgi:hypothetical protein